MKPDRAKRVRTGLKELRELAQITQAQLARKVGVAEKAVRSWENDGAIPSFDKAVKLARVLNVSLERLAQEFDLETEDPTTEQSADSVSPTTSASDDLLN